MNEPKMLLHTPDVLREIAEQLRAEADRCKARAEKIEGGIIEKECTPGCWNIFSTCIMVEHA